MLNWWAKSPQVYVLTALWALVILFLSAMPGKDMPSINLVQADKFAHAFVYGVLFILSAKSFANFGWRNALLLAAVLSVFYGVAMEFMQDRFFPDRFFDWMDAAANTVGVLIGIVIYKRLS